MSKRIVVTGATGFLGRRLCVRLIADGFEVIGIGRNTTIGKELSASGVDFQAGDLADFAFLKKVFAEAQCVIHCAGLSSPWGSYQDFFSANVVGTQHVTRACLDCGVKRLVHVSTPSLYFEYRDRLQIEESEPLPRCFANAYAETKFKAELVVNEAAKAGLETITIRPRGLVGAGDPSILPRVMRALERNRFPIFRQGTVMIDLTHVENVVDALILSLKAPSTLSGRVYNISNNQAMSVAKLYDFLVREQGIAYRTISLNYRMIYPFVVLSEIIHRWIQREPPFTRYSLGLLAYSNTLNNAAAERDLAYRPRLSVEDGIKEFLEWWNQK